MEKNELMQHVVLLLFTLSFIISNGSLVLSLTAEYSLLRDCQDPPNRDILYGQHVNKQVRIDLSGGAMIRSHIVGEEDYPVDFACIVIAYVPEGMMVMLQIRRLYIPSAKTTTCDDNFLNVFDCNTPRCKAMREAGGEKGLCQKEFPKEPIFTINPFVTIFFKSSVKMTTNAEPGFELMLTAVKDVKGSACPTGNFLCGPLPAPADPEEAKSPRVLIGYCIPDPLRCDSQPNCHDARDEDVTSAECEKDESLLARFLSLGVTASIAIAVGTIIGFTVCIGVFVCCCCRGCQRPWVTNKGASDVPMAFPPHPPGPASPQPSLRGAGEYRRVPPHLHNGAGGSPYPYKKDSQASSSAASSHQGYPPLVHTGPLPPSQTGSSLRSFPSSTAPVHYPRESYHSGTGPPPVTPNFHHSHTPTSSRSGKSARSGRSSYHSGPRGHVTYHHAIGQGQQQHGAVQERVQFPVQL